MKTGIRTFMEALGSRLLGSEAVKGLAHRYPRVYHWTVARFGLHSFMGLPLTVLTAVFIANTLLLADLAEDVVNAEDIILVDNNVTRWFYSIRTHTGGRFFYAVTQLASVYTVAGVAFASTLLLMRSRHWIALWGLLITLSGSVITMASGKHIFEVNRPHQFAYYHESSFSFPSGHATVAASFYLYLLYLVLRSVRGTAARMALAAIVLCIVLLIGLNRLYLCVHYLSDVMAGYCLGIGWLLLSISIVEWRREIKT
ncbi:MAG: phosphatase PAP2 family protein [Bacteroidetes bacterium]|nr:phosphatase PAP2 family protein [Bacteroidota bacterium]